MMIDTDKIPAKIGGTVLKLLCLLYEAEKRGERPTLTELAKALGIRTAGVTWAQDSAVKSGWVTSRHSAEDRRQKFLELTHAGLALVESMRPRGKAREGEKEGRGEGETGDGETLTADLCLLTSEGKEAA